MALIGNPIVASQPVDDAISSTSKNPVQNKTVKSELDKKVNKSDIDTALSTTSTNTVQNKVVKAGIDKVQENLDDIGLSPVEGALNTTYDGTTAEIIKDSTGKKIVSALYKIAGVYDLNDYRSITQAVRKGDEAKIPYGTVFTVPHSTYGNIDFVVRRRDVDKVYNDADRPTLTIQTKHLLSNNGGSSVATFQYDRPEAFASVETEIAAGTVVQFTTIAYGGWVAGTFHFTATDAIPVGAKLCISGVQSTALDQLNVQVFTDAKQTTASADYAIASGAGDATVDLGVWGTGLNHPQRVSYGSNNEAESNVFQFLNGIGLMSDIWTPMTKYDMMSTTYTTLNGFLGGFDEEFRQCLGLATINNISNNVFESQDSPYEKNAAYTHRGYFWLPSRMEIYGTLENNNENAETQFPYFEEIGITDSDKLMYAKGATSPTSYWLRTPYAGNSYNVLICTTGNGGGLNSHRALHSYGLSPLAILA